MKTKKIFIPILLAILLGNLSSCNKEPYEDCTLSFRINFVDKNTGECYKEIDSLLSVWGLDTLCLYENPTVLGETEERCLFRNGGSVGSCLYMVNSGVSFDKRTNPTFTYAIGKSPIFLDTIEFKYNSSTTEIRINGVLQEQITTCNERIVLNISK